MSNFRKNYLGGKSSLGKKQNFVIFFPRKYILQKFSNTLYEGCEDPQICIFKNYKHAAKIGRKKSWLQFYFSKNLSNGNTYTRSIGFALNSECKSNAHTLSFNRFIKKMSNQNNYKNYKVEALNLHPNSILVLCNKQFNIFYFILSR